MAQGLKKQGLPVITSDKLFNNLGAWIEARNSDDAELLWKAHVGIEESIRGTFDTLVQKLTSYESGRFSPEKFGQEVNWLWLDLAAASGVGDLMGVYLRQYNRDTPNSSMYFVNIT